MLTDVFRENKDSFPILKEFTLRVDNVSFIHNHIVLENRSYIATISVEETETYAGMTVERKRDKEIFYALSDYSYLKDATYMFHVLRGLDEKEFRENVVKCLKGKNQKRKELEFVRLVYRLLETFLMEDASGLLRNTEDGSLC
jgi:hypothetical protein